jgi:hypothetical protein
MSTDDSKAEKKARQSAEAKVAWDEHLAKKAAIDKNTERLRALRLAKEAKEAGEAKPVARKAAKKRAR